MDFIDEDSKPRFLLKGRSSYSSPHLETLQISKIHAACCLSAAAFFLVIAFSLSSSASIISTLLIWFSLSLILAPFAPPSVTGGDPRVGRGEPLPSPAPKPAEPTEPRRRPAFRWKPKSTLPSLSPVGTIHYKSEEKGADPSVHAGELSKRESSQPEEWTAEDLDILKRYILKHPAGAPGRWGRITEAFKGRHGEESVICMSKSLAEMRPPSDDSFAQFLKHRKPLDKRVDDVSGGSSLNDSGDDSAVRNSGWSSGEDIALLNALKVFPKNAPMRWDKVAAAVPSKSKAECMKRVAELKKHFRSLKNPES